MGCSDWIKFQCLDPRCNAPIEVQSKGGACRMKTFHPAVVPIGTASEVIGDKVTCGVCKKEYTIHGPATIRMDLIPYEPEEEGDF